MSETKKVKILMVDDHPSMLEGYKVILSYNDLGYELDTTLAHTCQAAFEIISNPANVNHFDLAFLDYSLPPYNEMKIHNGEDLGLLIKKYSPRTKIAILTSHTEALLLYQIIQNVDPNGMLVKSDFSAEELISAFGQMMEGETYYSKTVKQILEDILTPEKYLGKQNRQILSLICSGIKTKSLPEILNISLSAIEKRKTQIRAYLSLEKGTDEEIIREAKKRGLT
jgi:two-component system, NarL family, response regulator NreC